MKKRSTIVKYVLGRKNVFYLWLVFFSLLFSTFPLTAVADEVMTDIGSVSSGYVDDGSSVIIGDAESGADTNHDGSDPAACHDPINPIDDNVSPNTTVTPENEVHINNGNPVNVINNTTPPIVINPDNGTGDINDNVTEDPDTNEVNNSENTSSPDINISDVPDVPANQANNGGGCTYPDGAIIGGSIAGGGGGDIQTEGVPSIGIAEITIEDNWPPEPIIDDISPSLTTPGGTVSFTGDGYDRDGYIVGWEWSSSIDGLLSTQPSFTISGLTPGVHVIHFRVQDNLEVWSTEDAIQLVIIDNPPIAHTGEKPYFGWKQKPIMFDGSQSYDTDGRIIQYVWNFGDGTTASDVSPTHMYSHAGTFVVTLTVTDNYGIKDTKTTTATVVTRTPLAKAGGPYFGFVQESIAFNGGNSSDSDGSITKYMWDFGDGTNGTGKTPRHSYKASNTYFVTLTVTDDDGKTARDITYIVITKPIVAPDKPYLTSTPSKETEMTWKFTAMSTDADNDQVRYVFSWGDATETISPFSPSGTAVTVSHTWVTPGLYRVKVCAVDEKNVESEIAEITVFVASTIDLNTLHQGISPVGSELKIPFISKQLSSIIAGMMIALTFVAAVISFLRRKNYF